MSKGAWLTPDALPVGTRCIKVLVPDDEDFYSIFVGALVPLMFPENFEKLGSLTPEDCAQFFIDMDEQQTWEDCP